MNVKEVKGVKIPVLGLGTWQMRGSKCINAVRSALNQGYRHIDTAQLYGNEKQVGKGIKKSSVNRENIFLTTKLSRSNVDKESVIKSTERSLKKLGTDYVDLLLIHWPNTETPFKETLGAMEKLKQEGKVLNIGVSNFTSTQLKEALQYSPDIATNQVEMHPFLQQKDLAKFCVDKNVLITAYSPLAKGKVIGNRFLKKIGSKYGKTEAQVSINWLIQQKNVITIPKSSNPDRQKENLESLDFKLKKEDIEAINNIDKRLRVVDPLDSPW